MAAAEGGAEKDCLADRTYVMGYVRIAPQSTPYTYHTHIHTHHTHTHTHVVSVLCLQSTAFVKVGLKVCHPRSEAASRAVGPKPSTLEGLSSSFLLTSTRAGRRNVRPTSLLWSPACTLISILRCTSRP